MPLKEMQRFDARGFAVPRKCIALSSTVCARCTELAPVRCPGPNQKTNIQKIRVRYSTRLVETHNFSATRSVVSCMRIVLVGDKYKARTGEVHRHTDRDRRTDCSTSRYKKCEYAIRSILGD